MKLTCRSCGAQYDSTDRNRSYFFRSDGSIEIGSYSCPAEIAAEGRNIVFCPRCESGSLKRLSELMGGGRQKREG